MILLGGKWAERVYVDSAPIIYFFEDNRKYRERLKPVFEGGAELSTSTLTLAEVLVHPFKREDDRLVQAYGRLDESIAVLTVNADIATLAATLRASLGFRSPDAIHLATARRARADVFLTNDYRLRAFNRLFAEPRVMRVKDLQS